MNYHLHTRTSQTVIEYTYYCRVCQNEMTDLYINSYACQADCVGDHNNLIHISDDNDVSYEEVSIYEPDDHGYLVAVEFVDKTTTLANIQKYGNSTNEVIRDIIFTFDDPFDRDAFIDRFNKLMVLI